MQNETNQKLTVFTRRPMVQEEHKFSYAQDGQIQSLTALIGYLRGDFGSKGVEFFHTWFDFNTNRKTVPFRDEFDELVTMLREDLEVGPLLKSRTDLVRYCSRFPESLISEDLHHYGFRVDSEMYSYLIRVCPDKGDYNFYIYCYERKWLDYYFKKARNGIRFITSGYEEKFRIKDNEKIKITRADGETDTFICRYIDDYHVLVGRNTYHICEFAEMCEENKFTVEAV